MIEITKDRIKISLEIEGGDRIILLDMLSAPKSSSKEDVQRNIYRIDENGKIIWQLLPYDAFEISTFTNVYFSEKFELLGYNFDGGEYEIDINTGKVRPKQLLK